MAEQHTAIGPVTGKARIDVLDILRGLAILGIFFMNIPFEAASVTAQLQDIRLVGWTVADQRTWAFIAIALEGTQRCVLEFLFGAGMMVLTARAMTPDGPVAVADLYFRRTLWLMVFGLIDIFVVLWVGDILFIYSLAALMLFPFRRLRPRTLVLLGSVFTLFVVVGGAMTYADRTGLVSRVEVAQQHQAAHKPLTSTDSKALEEWNKKLERLSQKPNAEFRKKMAEENKAHAGGFLPYAQYAWNSWLEVFWQGGALPIGIFEAFCTMLFGIALWKWGIIQGQRSTAFYAAMALVAYAIGITVRAIGVAEVFTFAPYPKTIWITNEIGRLGVGLGHVALVNWAIRTRMGWSLLAPFRAAGRTAFSLYYIEQIVGLHIIFAPYGFNLWARYGWADMALIAVAMCAVLLVVANIWVRYFAIGPLEWAWRSLAYLKFQPFLRPRAVDAQLGGTILPA